MPAASQTYGPIFIGLVFNILLYGIMITQTFLYFTVYKRDKLWMKMFVLLLFICDTLNCAFDIAFVFIPLINNFGNEERLSYATWIFGTDPAMTAFIALFVQMFFAWRVKVLTNSITSVCVIAFCSLCQWCGGVGTSIAVGMIPEFIHFQKFQVIVIIWLAFSAVADSLITAALVWHLRKHKTGFHGTDDIVNRIIRLTVQTGLVTALCAVIDLILFLASPSGLHLAFNLPLSKLYTNSLMSSLNSRAGWKYGSGLGDNVSSDPSEVSRGHVKGLSMHGDINVSRRAGQEVFIDVESHEMIDVVDSKQPLSSSSHLQAASLYTMPSRARSPVDKSGRLSVGAVPHPAKS